MFSRNAGHYFEPLKELDRFKEVYCDYGTICWPNGADLCPDVLYEMGEDVPKTRKKIAKRLGGSRPKRQKKPRKKAAI